MGEKFMSKELYPRFTCPLCGWLAHYSMLEKAPHDIKVVGMKVEGFGGISYHKIRGAKKAYKEFLREKVRELAEELGLKFADEVDEVDEVDEEEYEEVETEPSEEILAEKPSGRVMEIPIERVERVPVEYADHALQQRKQRTARKPSYKGFIPAYARAIEKSHVMTADSFSMTIDYEFIDLGGDT